MHKLPLLGARALLHQPVCHVFAPTGCGDEDDTCVMFRGRPSPDSPRGGPLHFIAFHCTATCHNKHTRCSTLAGPGPVRANWLLLHCCIPLLLLLPCQLTALQIKIFAHALFFSSVVCSIAMHRSVVLSAGGVCSMLPLAARPARLAPHATP